MKGKPTIRKNNLQMKSILFPYHMLLFASECFDHGLIQVMFGCPENDKRSLSQNIKQIAFYLGSFIYPKQMIKSLAFLTENVGGSQGPKKGSILLTHQVIKRPNENHFSFITRDETGTEFKFGLDDDIT